MRISFTTSVLALTLGFSLAEGRAEAQTNPATQGPSISMEAHLRSQLSGIEDGPLQAEIRALGPDASVALIAIVNDAEALPFLRIRAITCLGWASGNRAKTFLRTLLRTEQDPMRLRAAIRTYAGREGARAVSVIAAHGENSDAAVREAVYLSLIAMLHTTPAPTRAQQTQVASALDRLLARETDAELAQRARSLRAAP